MAEKYYTPTIDEFHIGFEYEMKFIKEGWQREVFGIGEKCFDSVSGIKHALLGNKWSSHIRVKLLDHKDILECGWDSELDDIGYGIAISDNENMTLRPFIGSTLVEIQRNKKIENGRESINTKFLGAIRNKSELKTIMKMLNIKTQYKWQKK